MADAGERSRASETTGGTGNKENSSHQGPPQQGFDFLNWFYWSMWWQQYSYWLWHFQASSSPPHASHPHPHAPTTAGAAAASHPWLPGAGPPAQAGGGVGPDRGHTPQQQQQWAQYYNQQPYNPAAAFPWQQGAPAGLGAGPEQAAHTNLLLRIRFITGFEVFLAPLWKRMLAEFVDMILFGIILKLYMPEVDYRIPEVLFQGADVWTDLDDKELLEIRDTALVFLTSVAMERILHALMESLWVATIGCTPGKGLLGLRVWRCSSVHYTRTALGRSVKVEPAGKLSLLSSFARAFFKASVSFFCPLVVFFIVLKKGRTKYDELTGSIVVDTRSLCREVVAGRVAGPAADGGHGLGQPPVPDRPAAQVR